MHIAIATPPLALIRTSIAAVWIYEGLWCKLLGRAPSQQQVVNAVPRLGPGFGHTFLMLLGWVETALGLWVVAGVAPVECFIVQTALLLCLNVNGLLWARRLIHDPAGMVLKNIAFLLLAWVGATAPGARP
ncbi:MAG TPA: DoxX-like family protein [Acidobacteriaceae bacterium]|nr:DoxX-like family protein [Acidobacteriaceae bacterium]